MELIVNYRFFGLAVIICLTACMSTSLFAQVNDDFVDRSVLPSELPVSTTGNNVGASDEPNEPVHDLGLSQASVWWSWTAPNSGTVEINTFGSDFDTVLAVYTGTTIPTLNRIAVDNNSGGSLQSRVRFSAVMGTTYQIAVDGRSFNDEGNIALNISMASIADDFAIRITLPNVIPTSTTGSNFEATTEFSEPDHAESSPHVSVWWSWTAPVSEVVEIDTFGSDFDTVLAVYTGTALATLNGLAGNDNAGGGSQSRVRFSAVAGTTYQIVVGGRSFDDEGSIILNISMALPGSPNDDFPNSITLPGVLPISTNGSNVNASVELDEPDHTGRSAQASVWWSWTAPSSGDVLVDTFGSDLDTALAVYTGTALPILNEIASAYELASYGSRVRFPAVMGTTYHIAVDGHLGDEGRISLKFSMTSADSFSDRIALPSTSSVLATGSNFEATTEFGEPDHAESSSHASVWWSWTAPTSGDVEIGTFGMGFDTVLAIYTGTTLATLNEVPSTDNTGSGSLSLDRFSAVMGTTYQIAVGSRSFGDEGNVVLAITQVSAPIITSIQAIFPNRVQVDWEGVLGEMYDVVPSLDLSTWLPPRASTIATGTTNRTEIEIGPGENVNLFRIELKRDP